MNVHSKRNASENSLGLQKLSMKNLFFLFSFFFLVFLVSKITLKLCEKRNR